MSNNNLFINISLHELLKDIKILPKFDIRSANEFVNNGFVRGESTLIEQIKKVPPLKTVIINDNNNIITLDSAYYIKTGLNNYVDNLKLYLPEKEAIPSTMNDKESINRILINNIQKLSEKYTDNQKYNDETKKMVISIKIYLTKVEYEIIKYLSLFLQIIYPKNQTCNLSNIQTNENNIDKELVYEYKRFLYKLSLFLLGYNLDKINYNPDYSIPSIELLHSKMLIFIFELIIFYCCDSTTSDFSKEEDIYFMYKSKVDFHSLKKYL
jgi:hypothetical protein